MLLGCVCLQGLPKKSFSQTTYFILRVCGNAAGVYSVPSYLWGRKPKSKWPILKKKNLIPYVHAILPKNLFENEKCFSKSLWKQFVAKTCEFHTERCKFSSGGLLFPHCRAPKFSHIKSFPAFLLAPPPQFKVQSLSIEYAKETSSLPQNLPRVRNESDAPKVALEERALKVFLP